MLCYPHCHQFLHIFSLFQGFKCWRPFCIKVFKAILKLWNVRVVMGLGDHFISVFDRLGN